MASKVTITINTKEFERKFSNLVFRKAPVAMAKACGSAAVQLMEDTVNELPASPFLEGWLRGSGSVFEHCMAGKGSRFQNRFRVFSRAGLPRYGTTVLDENYREGEIGATTIFNAPYAAQWHENWPPSGKFSYGKAGIKYMERKIYDYWHDYLSIIASRMMEGIK